MNSNEEIPEVQTQPVFNPVLDQETWDRLRISRPISSWTEPVIASSLASFHRPPESAGPEAMRIYMNNFRGDRPPLLTIDEMNAEREQRGQAPILDYEMSYLEDLEDISPSETLNALQNQSDFFNANRASSLASFHRPANSNVNGISRVREVLSGTTELRPLSVSTNSGISRPLTSEESSRVLRFVNNPQTRSTTTEELERLRTMLREAESLPTTANVIQGANQTIHDEGLRERAINVRNILNDIPDSSPNLLITRDNHPVGHIIREPLQDTVINSVETRPESHRRNVVQSNIFNNTSQSTSKLQEQSYITLLSQLYGLPVTLPEFLIVNDLKLQFIPFSQLSKIQIERYIIEPLLQPWAGPPSTQNRIITIFGKNGMTYLVKALYDQVSNQIFSPII